MAKLYQAKYAVQKARREAEAKASKEVKRRRVAEEKEKKKRILEYFQQLQNKVLEEEAALLEDTKGSQVAGSKYKEVAFRDEEEQQPFKKARGKQLGKYCRGTAVKMESANPYKKSVCVLGRIV